MSGGATVSVFFHMKSLFLSSLVTTLSFALFATPLRAQNQTPPAEAGADTKALKEELQKALGEARKDPAVAAAIKSANIMALNKVAQTHPELADTAKKEIARLEKPAGKPAAAEGKKPGKKDGNKAEPAAESGDKPASLEAKKKNETKKDGDKAASTDAKKKTDKGAPEAPVNTSTNQ